MTTEPTTRRYRIVIRRIVEQSATLEIEAVSEQHAADAAKWNYDHYNPDWTTPAPMPADVLSIEPLDE